MHVLTLLLFRGDLKNWQILPLHTQDQFTETIVFGFFSHSTPAGEPCVLCVLLDKTHYLFFLSFNAELGCKGSSMIDDMPSAYRALAEVIVGVSDRWR